ncbi:MAG: SIMPL domain-containing protein [Granulosicoccaceae bacterium]
MSKFLVLVMLGLGFGSAAWAEELPKDRYHFSVSARSQADNDWMVVTLSVLQEDKDLARASSAVNKEMSWALEKLKGELEIQSSTESYRSQPIYSDKGRQVRSWRVTQTLRLEGANFLKLTEKLQVLQQRLSVQQMHFSIKPETRDLLVEDLMVEALANFRRRAKLIAHQMDARDFRPVNVQINTDGGRGYYPRPEMAMRSMAADMAAPAVAGGESDITVHVSAQIELQH